MVSFRKRSNKTGLPPGSPVYVGDKTSKRTRIRIIDYDADICDERELYDFSDIAKYRDTKTVTWINFDGIHNPELLEKVGKEFGIHPLVIEDILNTDQRSKIDDYEEYIFLVTRMFYNIKGIDEIRSEQISIIIGENYVLSFQETEGDIFDVLRNRLKQNKGKMRRLGPDYLGYSLVDMIVDNYFSIIEKLGEDLELLEDELVDDPGKSTLQRVYSIKQRMTELRKSVWPLRDAISRFNKLENALVSDTTRLYLRDVYDHTVQVIDAIETYRDTSASMIDIYLSSISFRMNEIMKVLTIISTIFIPLTFIVGLYGMNFQYFPEIGWKYGYLFVWTIMLCVAGGMLVYFRRKKWF
jgi:magnesium transporter